MAKRKPERVVSIKTGGQRELELPPGVKLLRTLEGHNNLIRSLVFDQKGHTLVSGGEDRTVKLWEVASGALLRTLEGHKGTIFALAYDSAAGTLASGSYDTTIKLWQVVSGRLLRTIHAYDDDVLSVAFNPAGTTLASAGGDNTVKLWDVAIGKSPRILRGHRITVAHVAFDPAGKMLASASADKTVKLWEVTSGKLLRTLESHESTVYCVTFNPAGKTLASASGDMTVKLWEVTSGRLLHSLEGHTRPVYAVAFSGDGRLLASKSDDGTLRLWSCETWETVAVIPEPTRFDWWIGGLTFHPTLPLLASVGSTPETQEDERSRLIHFWELDLGLLLGPASEAQPKLKAVHHTTAKIVLVGDHSVGKSGLGWRLAHGEFKEQAASHGQQFWVLPQLGKHRADGTECEAILWDLAGQPDYRLTHALFLDDVDLALVVFDASDLRDPLHGVEFWLKQLRVGQISSPSESDRTRACCPTILVGAQADRGTPRMTLEELGEFCRRREIGGYISTSAREGSGLNELTQRMKELIPWDDKPATVTTVTFKRIKDYVLKLKENPRPKKMLVSPSELRRRLEQTNADWEFTNPEMLTAVGHLENYGYVKRVRTSKGDERILLAPELLNNLAASFVLEARRNPKELGSLEEKRLLAGEYSFPELEKLLTGERDILLDSAALLFLEHNICFRETDPLGGLSFLVFPELINLKKPVLEDEQPIEEGPAYTVSGAVENVYASLVVLLGYTQTFTRTNQWQGHARYEVGERLICGFRQDDQRDGELDFVLYFGRNVGQPVRTLFQSLFESFLARRNLSVARFGPVVCSSGHALNRAVVRDELRDGKAFAFCSKCGERLNLQKAHGPIQLTQVEQRKVDEQQWFAEGRSRFEQAVFQVVSYVEGLKLGQPVCFISYAWGDREHERWVEKSLATDLQKAGIKVLLDRWEISRVGSSIMRFLEQIERCDQMIVVGTQQYRQKAKNAASKKGSVAAAEWDLAGIRMLATETQKQTVLPVLLSGDESESFPALLRGRVYADFRNERDYFVTAFDLILDLYEIPHTDAAVADLRESLRESEVR